MDKDRIKGSSTQAKGVVKELAGKALGDAKLTAEGQSDRAKGKLQSAIGGLKDGAQEEIARAAPPRRARPGLMCESVHSRTRQM
jgi:uncharacterized protein YjbJ (UPF0337 family)